MHSASTLLFEEYATLEELHTIEAELQTAEQHFQTSVEVLDNLHQVQYILHQGNLTAATFEFLNVDNQLNKSLGLNLTWDPNKSNEICSACLEGIGSTISDIWDKLLAVVKWIGAKIKAFFIKIGEWIGWSKKKEKVLEKKIEAVKAEAAVKPAADEPPKTYACTVYRDTLYHELVAELQSMIKDVDEMVHITKTVGNAYTAFVKEIAKHHTQHDQTGANNAAYDNVVISHMANINDLNVDRKKIKERIISQQKAFTHKYITNANLDDVVTLTHKAEIDTVIAHRSATFNTLVQMNLHKMTEDIASLRTMMDEVGEALGRAKAAAGGQIHYASTGPNKQVRDFLEITLDWVKTSTLCITRVKLVKDHIEQLINRDEDNISRALASANATPATKD